MTVKQKPMTQVEPERRGELEEQVKKTPTQEPEKPQPSQAPTVRPPENTSNSSQESLQPKTIQKPATPPPIKLPDDPDFRLFYEYMQVSWTPQAVTTHIANVMGAAPFALPPVGYWDIPNELKVNFAASVYKLMSSPKWLIRQWPLIRLLMGQNLRNFAWTCAVTTTLAMWDIIYGFTTLVQVMKQPETGQGAKNDTDKSVASTTGNVPQSK